MHSVLVIGSELKHHSLWYPTLLGVLVVIAAIVLFCGSVYLLLATNLGARLGFLVAVAALSGFMIVLSALWWTTKSPLNTFKGSIPTWKPLEVVSTLDQSKIVKVRTIEQDGTKLDTVAGAGVKATVDEVLVAKEALPSESALEPAANEFATFGFSDPTKYIVTNTYEIGGRETDGIKHFMTRFLHPPLYAVAEFCPATDTTPPKFGLPPLEAKCQTDNADFPEGSKFIVLRRSLGSLRVPPMVTFFISSILFVLSLLGLHWRERDEQARAAAGSIPAPAQA